MEKILIPELSKYFDGLGPWISIIISILIVLWFKDWASNFVKGIKFYRDPAFMPGDRVVIDDQNATIVNIGMTRSVFRIEYPDGRVTWRYVPNMKIDSLKLEKLIDKK